MESQLTLRLPAELSGKLDRAARRMNRKRTDVARRALAQFLDGGAPPGRPADLVRDLLGSVQSGIPDLCTRHREHLLARVVRGR